MKLHDIFALPSEQVSLSGIGIDHMWFPEIPSIDDYLGDQSWQEIEEEGRIVIRRVGAGEEGEQMYTVVFDGLPLMLVMRVGDRYDSEVQRYVIGLATLNLACGYLVAKFNAPATQEDMVDLGDEFFEDVVARYSGEQVLRNAGFAIHPADKRFRLFPNSRGLMATMSEDVFLVEAKPEVGEMPEYVRRGRAVLRRMRPLSEEEHQFNPRIRMVSEETGFVQWTWYEPVKQTRDIRDIVRI